ncbi:polyamine ABC transporter substrate-binding protein [Pseudoteredinibacter isoporae]|uniref:Spermidine/putrescine transport system substrate-binding protein n=1 Tax=Pseudoteredinibacter isoporae TaxID=570281 RepID=A0A7X0JTM8_9GAMM|nr:spermidine/putrescine ABC transporter substrate-binding protein [Pseudoteredinibacter isoporae]MBB6521513.1 spermidine/putrescine transport system substrate-binding protein [Pseudoteredinibacter isoporae]NHO87067.1 spermidine/putrescine ABC transporter substrate-binding protein [Pseudoteredinibacter isoporae]NIB22814.1 spermidine/putrescine ABC transporter substrate-binding protein [Pseudoteredinibacter isoporae]
MDATVLNTYTVYVYCVSRWAFMYRLLFIYLFLSFSNLAFCEPLRLLNWEDYIAPDIVAEWEAKNGKLEQVYFDSDQDRDAILINSQRHHIDVAVVDEVIASRFGREGMLLKLTEERLPSLKNIEPFWRKRCGDYAIPYLWGTLGIAYRKDKLKKAPEKWADLLSPSPDLYGHISMINDYTDILAPALFHLGFEVNTDDRGKLKQAFDLLKDQTGAVLTYEYPISYLGYSDKAEDLHMAMVYSGDQYSLNELAEAEDRWGYVVPEEGTVLWVDCLAISKSGKNLERALNFVNFISQPAQAARIASYGAIATPNSAAKAMIPLEQLNDRSIYPGEEQLSNIYLYQELSKSNIEVRLKITNAILNIHESKNTN